MAESRIAPNRRSSKPGVSTICGYLRIALRAARREHGVTILCLATGIGVSDSCIEQYEAGTRRIPAFRLYDVAQFLGEPISRFFPEETDHV